MEIETPIKTDNTIPASTKGIGSYFWRHNVYNGLSAPAISENAAKVALALINSVDSYNKEDGFINLNVKHSSFDNNPCAGLENETKLLHIYNENKEALIQVYENIVYDSYNNNPIRYLSFLAQNEASTEELTLLHETITNNKSVISVPMQKLTDKIICGFIEDVVIHALEEYRNIKEYNDHIASCF